jgi:hypothetical protein
MAVLGSRKVKSIACKELTMLPQGKFARTKAFRVLLFARSDCLGVVDDLTKPALGPTRSEVSKAKRFGVRYGALAVESGGAGPKEGPLEV